MFGGRACATGFTNCATVADRSVKNRVAVSFVGGTQDYIWRRGTTRNMRCPEELYMRRATVVQRTYFHFLNAILAHALYETCKSIVLTSYFGLIKV